MQTSLSPSLLDDLERCRALATDDAAYEREAVRWLARLAFERDACLDTVNAAAGAFAALREGDAAAAAGPRGLCRRRDRPPAADATAPRRPLASARPWSRSSPRRSS